ncbi:MAG TPA: sigma-70 family RNA polymerase sigma factor [Gemmataceae bacterium]|nr:sigma-70 family RNA polymerase sigma factor [Gemmataceae bacterium]
MSLLSHLGISYRIPDLRFTVTAAITGPSMHTTHASLLEQLRRPDDQRAWKRFVDLYTPLLFHWARRVGLAGPDAADLVQDVFTLLVRKLPQFQYNGAKGFRSWLHTVALNRWRETRRRMVPLAPAGDAVEELPDPATEEAFWEMDYRREVAARALQIMKRDFDAATWQSFWECVVEGRSAPDVGSALGLSAGAVRAAKFRVLCRLRRELDGLMD